MFQKIIKNYQKKLVNLSGSNRSLLLLKLSKENDLDLNEIDFLLNKPSFQIIENLIAGKQKFPVCNFLDSRNEKVNVVGKQLQKLNRKDRFLFEESGSKDLHVGWPFVQGKFNDGTQVRCPLLFFPVELVLDNNIWYLKQRENEHITFNKSFLLGWKYYNQAQLPEDFENFAFEAFSTESREFRTQLYELIKTNGLEIHFNQDLFIDKLQSFQNYNSGEFSELNETGRLKLFNEAVLGIFPQASSYLLPDYDILAEQDNFKDYDDFFNRKVDFQGSNIIKEADILTPLLIDAPQEEAIRMVKSGKSIVVQGPPGTGKSQLISNLVADYISKGKRALVVCQKRAALDVVYNRLSGTGAGTFVALVHDFKSDRSKLYNQAALQIDKVEEFKSANSQLNTVFLERDFLEACKKIDQATAELQEFKTALFDDTDCGFSVKELYLTSENSLPGLPGVSKYYKSFTRLNLNSFSEKLRHLLPYAIMFDSQEHAWQKRRSFKSYNSSDKTEIVSKLEDIESFNYSFSNYKVTFGLTTSAFTGFEKYLPLFAKIRQASSGDVFFEHFKTFSSGKYSLKKIGSLRKKLDKIKTALNEFDAKTQAKSISLENLKEVIQKVEKALLSHQSFIHRLLWKWGSKDKDQIVSLLIANRLTLDGNGLQEMKIRLHNLHEYLQFENETKELKEFDFVPAESLHDFNEITEKIDQAISLAEEWHVLNEVSPVPINTSQERASELMLVIDKFTSAVSNASIALKDFSFYFNNDHLDRLFEMESISLSVTSLKKDFDAIAEFDREKEKLDFNEALALQDILTYVTTSASSTVEDFVFAFENSVRLSWIDYIETRFPILSIVSTSKIGLLEQQLNEAIQNKRKLSGEILLLRLREQVYKNEEFNRLGNRTTFRDLHHQVNKKKKIWPLRKTIESFREELFYLIPCWLASPETVSAIFPFEQIFDIVIFDEASQCFTEKGLPAIARAKQVVITGDSKQLPPSDLYSTRFEDETDMPEAEINSLLDLATRFLPQVMLTEHYRSHSLDLIDFSNKHFYKGKLKLLPDFNTFQQGYKGIEYVKVNGLFEGRQNMIEAEKVVSLCMELFESNSKKEVGVITFNVNQQNLIQDLLEQHLVRENRTIPEGFIIKNIENIQGDEKDIIIFSIGYAPDGSGKMNHHFGSLNMEGGENRLNVAVTRAREKVIVISSIHPQQLNIENTLHEGPKLLKKYLEYALNVSEGRFVPSLPVSEGFRPGWFLKEKMKQEGKYKEDLPFADITEKDAKGSFVKLVLTDDDKFYNSVVKETFSYLPSTLKGKHWKFERVFSRNYSINSGEASF